MRTDPLRWEDDTGRVRWQPALGHETLNRDPWHGYLPMWRRHRQHDDDPVLHRWRWLAVLKAKREHRRRARQFQPS